MLGAAMLACLVPHHALAASQSELAVSVDERLVYTDAVWEGERAEIAQALRDGMQVALVWTFAIERMRSYWLDAEVGEVQLVRRVIPDLLTHDWILEDVGAGIRRRTVRLDDAVDFLTRVRHFPVLDRALLEPDSRYELVVTVETRTGEMSDSWWARLWRRASVTMKQEFRLP